MDERMQIEIKIVFLSCGDLKIKLFEECDDGNNIPFDGLSKMQIFLSFRLSCLLIWEMFKMQITKGID